MGVLGKLGIKIVDGIEKFNKEVVDFAILVRSFFRHFILMGQIFWETYFEALLGCFGPAQTFFIDLKS